MSHHIVRLASLFAALLLATPALAAPGLRLSWDHCALDGRVANKAFACDTNAGSELLVLSYEPPVAKNDCVGIEITMHIKSSSGVMPAWWQLQTGGCHADALLHDLSVGAAGTCEYPFGPSVAGGVAGYTADFLGPGSWRVRAVCAVPADQAFAIAPGSEYFAMAMTLRHTKTVGTGACDGCATPMCVGLGMMRIVDAQNVSNLDLVAGGGNLGGSEETVTWQGAYVREYTAIRERFTEYASMTCDPDDSVPALRSTWGSIKSLYR